MILIADTNLLVRILTEDAPDQTAMAQQALRSAEALIVPIVAFCELAWVLSVAYRYSRSEIATAISAIRRHPNIVCDTALIDVGLTMLESGGDFADAVIAADGQRLGGATFATFDKRAAQLLEAQGHNVTLLR